MKRKTTSASFTAQDVLAALKAATRLLAVGMTGIIIYYLVSGITMVAPNEAGIVLRFGKQLGPPRPPGLLAALPRPVDEVIKVPVKTVQEAPLTLWACAGADTGSLDPAAQPYSLTGDANIIRAHFVVRYQIADPAAYALGANDRERLRDAILYQAACKTISSMGVETILTIGKDEIGLRALRLAQREMDRLETGLRLLAFETKEVAPPSPVATAFQAVVSAKVQARTFVEEAHSEAASQLPGARAEANRIRQEAEAYASQITAKATGEADAFNTLLAQYAAHPALVRARLYGEALSAALPKAKLSTLLPGGNGAPRLLLAPQPGKNLRTSESAP